MAYRYPYRSSAVCFLYIFVRSGEFISFVQNITRLHDQQSTSPSTESPAVCFWREPRAGTALAAYIGFSKPAGTGVRVGAAPGAAEDFRRTTTTMPTVIMMTTATPAEDPMIVTSLVFAAALAAAASTVLVVVLTVVVLVDVTVVVVLVTEVVVLVTEVVVLVTEVVVLVTVVVVVVDETVVVVLVNDVVVEVAVAVVVMYRQLYSPGWQCRSILASHRSLRGSQSALSGSLVVVVVAVDVVL